jgi:hypothetical protein
VGPHRGIRLGVRRQLTCDRAKIIRSYRKDRQANFAYFFMGLGKVQSAEGVVRSLLKQLCIGQKRIPSELEWYLRSEKPTSAMSLQTLLKALRAMRVSTQDTELRPMYILLDAWDAANMDDQSKFYEIERTITSLGWKLLVTSGSTWLHQWSHGRDAVIFDIQADHNQGDIVKYVRKRLLDNTSVSKLLAMDERLLQEVVDRIAESSQGL